MLIKELTQLLESNTPYRKRTTKFHGIRNDGTPHTFFPEKDWVFMYRPELTGNTDPGITKKQASTSKVLAIGKKAAKKLNLKVGDRLTGEILDDFIKGGSLTAWFAGPSFEDHIKNAKSNLKAEWKRLGYGPDGEVIKK